MSTTKHIHAIDPDFYCANAYEEHQKRGVRHILIKLFSIVFLVGIALWGYKYMRSQDYFTLESLTANSTLIQKEIPVEKSNNEIKVAENKIESPKVTNAISNSALTSEEIAKIVQNVLIELNSEDKKSIKDQNNDLVDDRIYLKKNVEKRLKSDELSREYVESVRNALGN